MLEKMKNNFLVKAFLQLPLWAQFAVPAGVLIFLFVAISSITKFIKVFFLIGSVALIGYGAMSFYNYVMTDKK